jgi:hypothetical protein
MAGSAITMPHVHLVHDAACPAGFQDMRHCDMTDASARVFQDACFRTCGRPFRTCDHDAGLAITMPHVLKVCRSHDIRVAPTRYPCHDIRIYTRYPSRANTISVSRYPNIHTISESRQHDIRVTISECIHDIRVAPTRYPCPDVRIAPATSAMPRHRPILAEPALPHARMRRRCSSAAGRSCKPIHSEDVDACLQADHARLDM